MRARSVKVVLGAGVAAGLLAQSGCVSDATPPAITVASAAVADRSGEAVVFEIELLASNENPYELPLREVEYRVTLDGREVFRGTREARATLRRLGEQRFTLPAAVPTSDPAGFAMGGMLGVSGEITYEVPGSIAEALFDANLRRPSRTFSGEVPITADGDSEG